MLFLLKEEKSSFIIMSMFQETITIKKLKIFVKLALEQSKIKISNFLYVREAVKKQAEKLKSRKMNEG